MASTNTPGFSKASAPVPSRREPKTFAVTLSPDLAGKLEALAERERRDASDLLSDAFREYYGEFAFRSLEEVRQYAATRNPHGYTEEDIPRLIKDVRAERAAEEAARDAATRAPRQP